METWGPWLSPFPVVEDRDVDDSPLTPSLPAGSRSFALPPTVPRSAPHLILNAILPPFCLFAYAHNFLDRSLESYVYDRSDAGFTK